MKIEDKYNVVGHRVLIEPDSLEVKSESGIVLEIEGSKDFKLKEGATQTGTILAIGPNAWLDPGLSYNGDWAKVGDHVHFAKYAGKIVHCKDTERKLHLVNDEDIQLVEKE